MTTTEKAGKSVGMGDMPYSKDDIMYMVKALRLIIDAFGAHTVFPYIQVDIPHSEPYIASDATIKVMVSSMSPVGFIRKDKSHIRKLETIRFTVMHKYAQSSSERCYELDEAGIDCRDPANCDREMYEVWASTDGLQRHYRCRRWHDYQKPHHFFYDLRLCYSGIINGVAGYIREILEDFGYIIPDSVLLKACTDAGALASGFELGGSYGGELRHEEVKQ